MSRYDELLHIMESGKRVKKERYYFLTKEDMKETATLQPRVPQNFLVKNGYEDGKTKRVCFSTSINGALMALSQNLENTELYVYEAVDVSLSDIYKPSITEVPDKSITGEIWIKKPVTIKFIGKIRVKDAKETPHKYLYGDKTAELYDWNWEWIDKNINESFETFLTTNPFEKTIHLYHASHYQEKLKTISPLSRNFGSRLSSMRLSSFWAVDKNIALLMAIIKVISLCGYKVQCISGSRFVICNHDESEYYNIMNVLRDKVIWLYEKTMPKKYVKAGHDNIMEEYSIDIPVVPDKSTMYTFNDYKHFLTKDKFIFFTEEFLQSKGKSWYKNFVMNEMQIIKKENGRFLGNLLFKTPETRGKINKDFKLLNTSINESGNNIDYEPPMSLNDIKNKYGHDLYNKLKKDPIHRWRAETGIELIHKEPTLKELNRIMDNWNRMDDKQKFISDKKSMELFGCTNINNYNKLIKSYTTESTINSNLLNEKSLDNFSKVYGAYDLKDRWNAAIDIDGKTYRYRVEVLVIQGNSVFLSTDKYGGIIIPGGSGEKDIPDIVQVMNECKEEARINIKNVKYTGITRIQGLPPHIGKSKLTLPFTYEGSFSKIYVAEYDSPFTGFVDKRDEDKNMIKGKFYPIKSVINKLKPEWKAALSQYAVSGIMEACKDLKSAREFVVEVGKLAKKYDANYFIVTDGASGISNKGNPAVRNARLAQIEWEKRNNFDPDEDWNKEFSEATFEKSESSILNKIHSSRSKLNKYNSESLTIDILNKYKKQYRNLSHVKINDSTDGRIYTDNGKVVAMVNTQKKADGSIWIQGLEVFGEYRGQELSYGLLDIAVRELRSNYLSVRKTNSKAIKLYNNYGFITYKQDNYMQYMRYRSDNMYESTDALSVDDSAEI